MTNQTTAATVTQPVGACRPTNPDCNQSFPILAVEALSSPRLSQVIARLALLADLVIWDSAPVVALTDAALIGNYADYYYYKYTGRYGYVLREPWVSRAIARRLAGQRRLGDGQPLWHKAGGQVFRLERKAVTNNALAPTAVATIAAPRSPTPSVALRTARGTRA